MRKPWIMAVALLALGLSLAVIALNGRPAPATADETDGQANLPVVLKPENTPTPTVTPTVAPTLTATPIVSPTPYSTLVPKPSPTPGFGPNLLANGSFEEGWTDLPPVDGFLINQEPNDWELTWLPKGEEVWDLRTIHPDDPQVGIVTGIAEMLHKLKNQLPPDEQPGGPKALILEGEAVYKIFHRGAAFGSQLYQTVTLPAGTWRLTVPVQLHWHEPLDPNDMTWDTYTAESGAWVLTGTTQAGGWATARDMGDRRWFFHVIEFSLPAQTEVEILIRVKSIYSSPKDFFIDAVWLQGISSSAYLPGPIMGPEDGRLVSWPQPLNEIPAAAIVRP